MTEWDFGHFGRNWISTSGNGWISFDVKANIKKNPDTMTLLDLSRAKTWRGHVLRAVVSILERKLPWEK